MTEEEAAALGWEGAELREYLAGREEAARRIAKILTAKPTAPEPAPETPLGPTEVRAHQLAAQLIAEADAAEAKARIQRYRAGVRVVEVAAGNAPSAGERRLWALKKAAQDHPRVIRPSAEQFDVVYHLPQPDGTTEPRMVRQDSLIRQQVILPGEWDAFMAAEQERRDREGDELLIKAYGQAACEQNGILSWQLASAAEAEPTLPRAWNASLPPGVEGL